jgi:hypothetical protein
MVNYTDICLVPRAAHSVHMRKQPDFKQALARTIQLKGRPGVLLRTGKHADIVEATRRFEIALRRDKYDYDHMFGQV